jgi:hypothetical protein
MHHLKCRPTFPKSVSVSAVTLIVGTGSFSVCQTARCYIAEDSHLKTTVLSSMSRLILVEEEVIRLEVNLYLLP